MIVSFFKNAGILGVTDVLLRLKDLVIVPLLAKHFGVVEFGVWTQVRVLVNVLSPLVVMGADQGALRFLPGASTERKHRALVTLLLFILVTSSAVVAILFSLNVSLTESFFESSQNARFVTLCGLVIFSRRLLFLSQHWLRIDERIRAFAVVNVVRSMTATLTVVGVLLLDEGVFELVMITSAFELMIALPLLAGMLRRHGVCAPDWSLLRQFLRFGLPLVPLMFSMQIIHFSDRLFILEYFSMVEVGVYSVVYTLCHDFLFGLYRPLSTMYPVKAAELYNTRDFDGLNRLFDYTTRAGLALLLPVLAGISVLREPLLLVLTKDEFLPGASVMGLIGFSFVCVLAAGAFSQSLRLVEKQHLATWTMVVAAAVNLILNAVLVPVHGILGAALATAASFLLNLVVMIVFAMRLLPLHFDMAFTLKAASASIVMAVAMWAAAPVGALPLLLTTLSGGILYVIVMLLVRALSAEECVVLLRNGNLANLTRYRVVRFIIGLS